jgi:CBS domain-containing protein
MSTQMNKNILVSEVMLSVEFCPVVSENVILKEALEQMGKLKLGISCIVDIEGKLLGILTDGDIRRKLLKSQKPLSALFVDDALIHSIREPIIVHPSDSLFDSVTLMDKNQVWDLPVVDIHNKLLGVLHSHRAVAVLLGIKNE